MIEKKKILFITGTRADYGKIKPLIRCVDDSEAFEAYIYVSGMHLIERFGNTYNEVLKDHYKNVYVAYGLEPTKSMSINLGNTICYLSGYINKKRPDMIVVHGDRIDALAGAIVGALNNIIVAHIEGGEVSGTIDESIRHAVSKFAHLHFVSNEEAKVRLIQLGEKKENIFVIGSPDIDVMLSVSLPEIMQVKEYYEIPFDNYALFMYHPVTTENHLIGRNIKIVLEALMQSQKNYIVVYPNNDTGSEIIINELKQLEHNPRFKVYPSLRFEYFLTLLKNADFIIGNSSAGVREACIYGTPSIDIGTRQYGRYKLAELRNIQSVREEVPEILSAINRVAQYRTATTMFGQGNSTEEFLKIIKTKNIWEIDIQKKFIDLGDI
ncbi:MAG: UDP-N-acetyl-D-glucosamine 2-epimerase, UDP-hydrolyzing [Firmicutes bacterium]|nr:UDP-N-acetyl-D-glucosamine 2-epimerase, UDP-hydrolyzing [Bacillota bacterium]